MLEALTGAALWRPEVAPWPAVEAAPAAVEAATRALSRGGAVWVVGPLAEARAVARAAAGSGAVELDLRGCSHLASARVTLGQHLGRFPAAGPLGTPPPRTVAGCAVEGPLSHAASWLGPGIARAWFCEQEPPVGGAPVVVLPTTPKGAAPPLPSPTPWLAIADGGPLPRSPRVVDALALEAAPADDGRAPAAAARLWGRWGALDHARQLLRDAAMRGGAPAATGRLAWAEAEAFERWGAPAWEAWEAAQQALRAPECAGLLSALLRRRAALEGRRGAFSAAERLGADAARVARDAGREADLGLGTLGSAELALRAGQPIGARVLLDQLAGATDPEVAAGAALARSILDPGAPRPSAVGLPEHRAAAALLSAARGDQPASAAALDQARALYESLGEPAGVALALRLLGDRAARGGAVGRADALWRRALALHVADRDAPAASATLDRLGRVARAAGDLESAAVIAGLSRDLSGDQSA